MVNLVLCDELDILIVLVCNVGEEGLI